MKKSKVALGVILIIVGAVILLLGSSIRIETPSEYKENIPVSFYSYAKSIPIVSEGDIIKGGFQVTSPENGTVHFSVILAHRENVGEKPTYDIIYSKKSVSSDDFEIEITQHGVIEFEFDNTDEIEKEVEFHYEIANLEEEPALWTFFLPAGCFVLIIGVVLIVLGLKPSKEKYPPYVQQPLVQQPFYQTQQHLCPYCQQPLIFIQQHNRWYCYKCRRYI